MQRPDEHLTTAQAAEEEVGVTTSGEPTAVTRAGSSGGTVARALAKGTAWNTLGQFGPLVSNLLLTPYVIHGLGHDRYGLFILVSSISAFLASFDGGIGVSAQRYFAIYAGRDDKVATTRLLFTLSSLITAVGVALFAVIYISSPPILSAMGVPKDLRPEGVILMRTLAVIVGFSLIRGLFNSVLSARGRFGLYNIVGLVLYSAYAVSAIVSVKYGFGLRGIAVGLGTQSVLAAVLLIPQSLKYLDRSGLRLLPWSEVQAFLSYATKVQAVSLAKLINTSADNIITGAFVHPVGNVGKLGTGATFAEQLRMVPNNALLPIQTVLGRAFGQSGEEGAAAEFARVQRVWVIACTGWSVVAMSAAFYGVRQWLSDEYAVSGLVAAILVAGNMMNLWVRVAALWTGIVGKPAIEARYALLSVAINGVLTMAFVVPFGIVGVVAATAIGQVVAGFYLVRRCKRDLLVQIPSFLRDIPVIPAVVCGLLNVGVEQLLHPYFPRGAAGLLLCAAAAGPAFVLFFVMTLGPRQALDLVGTKVTLPRWLRSYAPKSRDSAKNR